MVISPGKKATFQFLTYFPRSRGERSKDTTVKFKCHSKGHRVKVKVVRDVFYPIVSLEVRDMGILIFKNLVWLDNTLLKNNEGNCSLPHGKKLFICFMPESSMEVNLMKPQYLEMSCTWFPSQTAYFSIDLYSCRFCTADRGKATKLLHLICMLFMPQTSFQLYPDPTSACSFRI